MVRIGAADIVNMNRLVGKEPIEIDLVYANAEHPENHFGQLYQDGAQLYLHKDLAEIVIEAAHIVKEKYDWNLVLFDGLRTVEAQEGMVEAKNKNNWADDMVSPPGYGAHPRGMAIDLAAIDSFDSSRISFGAEFDQFDERAGRKFSGHHPDEMRNRERLNDAMLEAAKNQGKELELLETEFWDFRLPEEIWSKYDALKDKDLRQMGLSKMTLSREQNPDL